MLQVVRSFKVFIGLSLICGLVYPLAVIGISQSFFFDQANASLIKNGDMIIGSLLIGQQFTGREYFHGRPSAIDPPYDASNSGGSNMAPTSAKLIELARKRVIQVRKENNLPADAPIPADLVLASASGLDPHISPQSALLQVKRIAEERKTDEREIKILIEENTEQPLLGFWGKERVNILKLNLALDGIKRKN